LEVFVKCLAAAVLQHSGTHLMKANIHRTQTIMITDIVIFIKDQTTDGCVCCATLIIDDSESIV
jgi:hypothetical protein